jgi:hypothetical protein
LNIQRGFVLSFIIFLALIVPFSTQAQDDLNCDDFAYQEDAQAVFDQDISDSNQFDNNNEIVCENLDSRPATPVLATPVPSTPTPSPSELTDTLTKAAVETLKNVLRDILGNTLGLEGSLI